MFKIDVLNDKTYSKLIAPLLFVLFIAVLCILPPYQTSLNCNRQDGFCLYKETNWINHSNTLYKIKIFEIKDIQVKREYNVMPTKTGGTAPTYPLIISTMNGYNFYLFEAEHNQQEQILRYQNIQSFLKSNNNTFHITFNRYSPIIVYIFAIFGIFIVFALLKPQKK